MIYPYRDIIKIPFGNISLEGDLAIPRNAETLVIFSHGTGNSRYSPKNNFVAQHFYRKGVATFLFDLLTREEDRVYSKRFDIPLLTERLVFTTNWLSKIAPVNLLRFGYFGVNSGAASAIQASVQLAGKIEALVIRGGRPDLASRVLHKLQIPTLFIVGELDSIVKQINQDAFKQLTCEKQFELIKSAGHLFEEYGAIDEVARLSEQWFLKHLSKKRKDSLEFH